MVTLKTSWNNAKRKANVTGRWHDNRHTFITGLAESGEAGDETIRDMAGHVSKQMLKHYSHIRMEAKRRALEAIVTKPDLKVAGNAVSVPREPAVPAVGAPAPIAQLRIRRQVDLDVPQDVPLAGVAETNVNPAGSGSPTTMFVASLRRF
jgi:hypothetical protein